MGSTGRIESVSFYDTITDEDWLEGLRYAVQEKRKEGLSREQEPIEEMERGELLEELSKR